MRVSRADRQVLDDQDHAPLTPAEIAQYDQACAEAGEALNSVIRNYLDGVEVLGETAATICLAHSTLTAMQINPCAVANIVTLAVKRLSSI